MAVRSKDGVVSTPTTAQSLGALLKSARDIMRKDKGLIKRNELAGIPPPPGKRKWLVTRKSLEKLRNELLTR